MDNASYTTLPPFLQLSRSGRLALYILHKASDLQWSEHMRLAAGDRATEKAPSPWSRLSSSITLERNRYGNIDPFAANRIRLRVPDSKHDYINASPIVLKSTKTGNERRWIATQGPKHPTAPHLYRMLFDETGSPETPATVIMLTQTHEAGKEKCFQYYPLDMRDSVMEIPDVFYHGDGWRARVELLSCDFIEALKSERRVMKLTICSKRLEGKERSKIIHHYLYSAWPDFGVPEKSDRAALVELVRATRRTPNQNPLELGGSTWHTSTASSEKMEGEVPRIVHCSAGVGRSGTFIALDYLLSELEEGAFDVTGSKDWDPIADAVESMRQQRMMMVQGETQFLLLYEIMRQLWLARHGLGPPLS